MGEQGTRGSIRLDDGAGVGGSLWAREGVEKVSVVHPGDRDNGGHFRGSLWEVSRGVVAVSGQVTCPRQLSEAVGGQRAGRGRQALGEQGPGRAGPPPGGDMGVVAGPVVACLAQGLGPVLVARRRPRCPQLWGGRGGR